jgi:hypothetical protein
MLIFPLSPDHGLEGQCIAPLFGLEVFVELFSLVLGNAGFNAVGSPDGYYVSCNKMGAIIILDKQQKVPGRGETWLPLSVSRFVLCRCRRQTWRNVEDKSEQQTNGELMLLLIQFVSSLYCIFCILLLLNGLLSDSLSLVLGTLLYAG